MDAARKNLLKKLLVHEAVVKRASETDRDRNAVSWEEWVFSSVRFQLSRSRSDGAGGKTAADSATMFIVDGVTEVADADGNAVPFFVPKKGDAVEFGGVSCSVESVSPKYRMADGSAHHWEIGLK